MKFSEVVTRTLDWLQREGRVSYRALKLEFELSDEVLDALKDELIDAKRLAIDENGKVLVWTGALVEPETEKRRNGERQARSPSSPIPNPRPPAPSGAAAVDGDVLRPRRLHGPIRPARSRGVTQGRARLSTHLWGDHHAL